MSKSYFYSNSGIAYPPINNTGYFNQKTQILNENKNYYYKKNNILNSQISIPYQNKNKSIKDKRQTQYFGSSKNKAFDYDIEYNDPKIKNPSITSKSFVNESPKKKVQNIIDFKNYDLNNYKEYFKRKLYIITQNDPIKLNSRNATQIMYNPYKFINSSKEAKEILQNNKQFFLVDEEFLVSKRINKEGNYVLLYEIDQKAYIFFPKEEIIIEIPKKRDFSSDVKKSKEDEKLNIINNSKDSNENKEDSSIQPMDLDEQISTNEKDDNETTLKTLILLYGFQKNFIKLMKSPITDEFGFKKYYLIKTN